MKLNRKEKCYCWSEGPKGEMFWSDGPKKMSPADLDPFFFQAVLATLDGKVTPGMPYWGHPYIIEFTNFIDEDVGRGRYQEVSYR